MPCKNHSSEHTPAISKLNTMISLKLNICKFIENFISKNVYNAVMQDRDLVILTCSETM